MPLGKVLIVEDDPLCATMSRDSLVRAGYDVGAVVSTAAEALRAAESFPADLAIVDILLPGDLDGVEAAKELRGRRDIAVVFLTASRDPEVIARAKAAGPEAILWKPCGDDNLLLAVDVALARHRAFMEKKRDQARLDAILRSINDGILTTDARGRVTFMNPMAEALTGWSAGEALGRDYREVVRLERDASGGTDSNAKAHALSDGLTTELGDGFTLLARGGARHPVEGMSWSIKDNGNGESGAVLIFRDASEKRRTQRALEATLTDLKDSHEAINQQRNFFKAMFESLPCGILAVSLDNRVRAVNPTLEQAWGVSGKIAAGKTTGLALGCAPALGLNKECREGECCGSCLIARASQDAFSGLPVQRRRGTIRLLKDGRPHEAQILISAATGSIAGEPLCFLMLEDLTELVTLRSRLESKAELEGMVGRDPGMRELFETVREVADSPAPVLVLGESGTGKEMVAKAIHNQSSRASEHFVAVNCGALPEGLLESELFGHVKGAFTGAIRDKKGRFELADGGTLFLDEIAELGLPMQVKLLRVLQDGSFNRVGDEKTRQADVRLICATNRDLRREVAQGRFREDLYYRLAVVPIQVPPLRDRPADIPVLAEHLLARIAEEHGRERANPAPETLALLVDHRWPGNVRELGNVLEYAFIKSKGGVITPEHLPPALRTHAGKMPPRSRRRRKLDGQAVARALERTDGNKVMAAKLLGVSRATLYRFLDSEGGAESESLASS